MSLEQKNPWKGKVIYELYTPSFMDSNGDGWGDLKGAESKLSYLNYLGVDVIWFPPIFKSPQKDSGYDVSDYRKIEPRFGSLKQCLSLINRIHSQGMQVCFDLVVNHTSNQHPWFVEAASSPESPTRDYYIWKNPNPDGTEPNNWVANFGGSYWERIGEQYYGHSFAPEQPDLNYRNPKVLKAMGDNMRFWYDHGVDMIRLDALPWVMKHPDMPPERENPNFKAENGDHPFTRLIHDYAIYQPEMLDVLGYFCRIASEYQGKFVISEAYPPPNVDQSWVEKLYQAADSSLHAPFNFGPVFTPFNSGQFPQFVDKTYSKLRTNDLPIFQLSSHDVPRLRDRVGDDQLRGAMMWLLTTPSSMPVLYNGDEIGMKGQFIPPPLRRDVFHRFDPNSTKSRDIARLPIPWDASTNGGFTTGQPWLPITEEYKTNNVESQLNDPYSLLNMVKALIHHRKQSETMKFGRYNRVKVGSDQVYAYECIGDTAKEAVFLNFSGQTQKITYDSPSLREIISTLLDTQPGSNIDPDNFYLRPNEGKLISA
jgi:alpha-glucosidase